MSTSSLSRRLTWLAGLLVPGLLGGCGDSPVSPDAETLPDGAVLVDARAGEGLQGDGPGASVCDAGPALVAKIDPSRMLADLTALTGLGDRSSPAGQGKAAEYLKQQLAQAGLQVRSLAYSYKGASYENLEATLPGELADRFVFVGAHYDAGSGSPGADDDASGTVAVLEAARALAGCRLKRTLRFLLFSNEEAGTVGSKAYVKAIAAEVPPSNLLGFLSLDMIGYARPGEDLDVASRPAHAALVDQVAAAIAKHTSLSVKKVVNDQCG